MGRISLPEEAGWGYSHPADFAEYTERSETAVSNRKWYPWTAANDLAAKEFMRDGNYLVRCNICKEEQYQSSGVYLCPKPECATAVAVLIELGYDDSWGDLADEWYTNANWYDESSTLAEPTTEGD